MQVDEVVRFGLMLSIWLIVLSLGARASAQSALFLLRRPMAALGALTAMFVVVPAFALFLAGTTSIAGPIKFAILAMSVGPVPPILPGKQIRAGGDEDYALGLLVAASLAAVVLTPLLIALAARLLETEAAIGPGQVARILLITIGAPLAAGLLVGAVARRIAEPLARVAQPLGGALLVGLLVVMLVTAWRDMLALLGGGGALAIAAVIAVGLLAGRVLGGSRHGGALALAAASRHPGVALAIAEINYPDQRKPIMAAVLLFLLISALLTAPYVRWLQSRAAQAEPPTPGRA